MHAGAGNRTAGLFTAAFGAGAGQRSEAVGLQGGRHISGGSDGDGDGGSNNNTSHATRGAEALGQGRGRAAAVLHLQVPPGERPIREPAAGPTTPDPAAHPGEGVSPPGPGSPRPAYGTTPDLSGYGTTEPVAGGLGYSGRRPERPSIIPCPGAGAPAALVPDPTCVPRPPPPGPRPLAGHPSAPAVGANKEGVLCLRTSGASKLAL